jgi:hypothetical protein
MTYGWMLLVVALVGGLLFALFQDQELESQTVEGFEGEDVRVEEVAASNDSVQLSLSSYGSEDIESAELCLNHDSFDESCSESFSIARLNDETLTLDSFNDSNDTYTYDVSINYETSSGLSDTVEGTVTLQAESTGNTDNVDNPPSGPTTYDIADESDVSSWSKTDFISADTSYNPDAIKVNGTNGKNNVTYLNSSDFVENADLTQNGNLTTQLRMGEVSGLIGFKINSPNSVSDTKGYYINLVNTTNEFAIINGSDADAASPERFASDSSGEFNVDEWYNLEVRINDSDITAYINDTNGDEISISTSVKSEFSSLKNIGLGTTYFDNTYWVRNITYTQN